MITLKKNPGFTLIEMIIAITVFTIFIGFSISAYLTFHRADQEALIERNLVMSAQAIMADLSEAIRENKIDYDSYDSSVGTGILPLVDAEGEHALFYEWDDEEELLRLNGEPLHPEAIQVTYASFDIFPEQNPFENRTVDALQYQPIVRIELTFVMPGRVTKELDLTLHTSVTTRFYQ